MNLTRKTNVTLVSRETTLEVIRVLDNVNVIRLTTTEKKTSSNMGDLKVEVDTAPSVRESFIDDRNLKLLENGSDHEIIKGLYPFNELIAKTAQEKGYVEATDEIYKIGSIFDFYRNGGKDVVRLDHSSHMMFDVEGVPYPVMHYFDYIVAQMNNGYYDIDLAAKILGDRPDILLHGGDNPVQDVPYYNSSDECSRYVSGSWFPSREDYIRVWDYCVSFEASYPSTMIHKAIFDLDIWGLRAGGAARKDTFYG